MLNEINLVLDIALSGLEEQTHQSNPALGANGHLYYVLEQLAACRLTKKQQAKVKLIEDLHKQCVYGKRSR